MIVTVRHPGPVWHVPRGARLPRLGFVPLASQVRLREAAAGDMVPVRKVGPGLSGEIHAFEGDLWRRPSRRDGSERGGEIGAADLAAYLSAPVPLPHRLDHDLMAHFYRGPVLGAGLLGTASRGDAVTERARRFLHDGREAAAARLAAFLARDVVLAGGVPYLRCRPMLFADRRAKDGTGRTLRLDAGYWRARVFIPPASQDPDREIEGYPFRPDGADALDAFLRASGVSMPRGTGSSRGPTAPAGPFGDDDLVLMANVLPEFVVGEARAVLAAHGGRAVGAPRAAETVAARIEALLPAAVDGSVGGVALDAAPAALERCLALSEAIQALAGPLWSATRLPMLERYLRDHALPRLAGPGLDDDMDAVGRLAP